MGGEILEIKNAFVYENIAPVFDDFIENFKKIREKGGYFNVIGKLIINSLYGSFGLRNEDSKMIVTFSDKEFNFILKNLDVINHFKINDVGILNIAVNHKFKLNYNKLSFLENGEFSKRNVSYASSISSKARVKLYRAIQECLNDGGRLLYTDTDSIFAAYNLNNKSEEFYNKK
jgi:DNA polymerase elongation subunit (family B)